MITFLALVLAAPILVRCICVSAHISGREFAASRGRQRWHGFAISYIALGAAAGFAVLDVFRTGGTPAVWFFLIASAGLVVFDPRRPT